MARRLTWKPGVPSTGPTRGVYYSEAKFPVGDAHVYFTISRVTVGGVERFVLWMDNQHIARYERSGLACEKAEYLLDERAPRQEAA